MASEKSVKRVSVVTPCLNAETYIQDTMLSVINSGLGVSGRVEMEYIICDGASSDRTLHIVEDTVKRYADSGIRFELISEKDNGLYDAVAKGLAKATGDVLSYLNAGDVYSPQAHVIVTDIFGRLKVKWLTGFTVVYNELNQMIGVWLPFRYRRSLIRCGYYDGRLPFVQQETTFWHRDLLRQVDLDRLISFRIAGDYYLWHSFAGAEELYIAAAWLGGWKIHTGQLSTDIESYRREMKTIARKPGLGDMLRAATDRLFFIMPNDLKQRLNPHTLIRFDLQSNAWRFGDGYTR